MPPRRSQRARPWGAPEVARRPDVAPRASPTARSTWPASPGRTCRRCAAPASRPGSSSSTAAASIPRPTGRSTAAARCPRRLLTQFGALARLLPAHRHLPLLLRADARPEVAPVPDPARDRQEERLPLPRLRHPRQDAARSSPTASAPTPRSSAPTPRCAGCPRPTSCRPGSTCAQFVPQPPSRQPPPARRPRALQPRQEGHAVRHRRLRAAAGRARDRRGRPPRRGARALRRRRHRRRPAQRRLARRLRARGDGARQARRRLPRPRGGRAQRRGLRAARSRSCRPPRRRSTEALRPLVESPALRGEIGEEGRHYVEQVHDIDRIADRLLEIYREISPARARRRGAAPGRARRPGAPRAPRRAPGRRRARRRGGARRRRRCA